MAWKTTDDPKSVSIPTRWTVGEAAELDAMCAAKGQSRSALLRDCWRRVRDAEKRKAQALASRGED